MNYMIHGHFLAPLDCFDKLSVDASELIVLGPLQEVIRSVGVGQLPRFAGEFRWELKGSNMHVCLVKCYKMSMTSAIDPYVSCILLYCLPQI